MKETLIPGKARFDTPLLTPNPSQSHKTCAAPHRYFFHIPPQYSKESKPPPAEAATSNQTAPPPEIPASPCRVKAQTHAPSPTPSMSENPSSKVRRAKSQSPTAKSQRRTPHDSNLKLVDPFNHRLGPALERSNIAHAIPREFLTLRAPDRFVPLQEPWHEELLRHRR